MTCELVGDATHRHGLPRDRSGRPSTEVLSCAVISGRVDDHECIVEHVTEDVARSRR
jgi:hypothetical protein